MSKIMIAGINGFVGGHLAKELYDNGIKVIGVSNDENLRNGLEEYIEEYISCDLSDIEAVRKLSFENIKAVINLAGFANVGASFDQKDLYMRVNVDVHTNIASVIEANGEKIRLISVSSGSVYSSDQTMPLNESSKLVEDSSPYTESKIVMENRMKDFRKKGLDVVIVRPFNHTGPGQQPGFLIPDLANQIISNTVVNVGNLDTKRDYTDVRDVVKAYRKLALADILRFDTYNICSSRSIAGKKILDLLLDKSGRRGDIKVKVDSSKIRPNDQMDIYGDNSRIKTELGWSPMISIEQTIEDFIDWLRSISVN